MLDLLNHFLTTIPIAILAYIMTYTAKLIKIKDKSSIVRFSPLLLVGFIIVSVIFISFYYEHKYNQEVEKFKLLSNLDVDKRIDSVSVEISAKQQLLDSLQKNDAELSSILSALQIQKIIVGDRKKAVESVINTQKKNRELISKVQNYNDVMSEPSTISNNGYTRHGETSNFTFYPPKNRNSDYIDLAILFNNDKLVKDVYCIYIEVTKIDSKNNINLVFCQYYKPQMGINSFRIKNYLRDKNTILSVGYFTKYEMSHNKYPIYEHIDYK